MPIVVNTNVPSLNAQRSLNGSGNTLNQAYQRLASGLRVNSAKDDAAGLAIANRLQAQSRGLDQAVRNASDGISMAQVAEGALQETTNAVQRIRELAIQAANGSLSSDDKTAIQAEIDQLIAEVDRIADTTRFGDVNLLDGSFGSKNFQVGAKANETVSVSTGNGKSEALGSYSITLEESGATAIELSDTIAAGANNTSVANGLQAATLTIADSIGTSTTIATGAGDSASTIAGLINAQTDVTGVTANAKSAARLTASAGGSYSITFGESGSETTITAVVASGTDHSALADAINAESGLGLRAVDNGTSVDIFDDDGNDIVISDVLETPDTDTLDVQSLDYAGTTTVGTAVTLGAAVGTDSTRVIGSLKLTSSSSFSLESTIANEMTGVAANTTVSATLAKVEDIDVSTETGAQSAIEVAEGALTQIDSIRSTLGAIQNRFETTIASLSATSENAKAGESRIRDADFAAESAKLGKATVLQQASTAVLAQANAQPQLALQLLA